LIALKHRFRRHLDLSLVEVFVADIKKTPIHISQLKGELLQDVQVSFLIEVFSARKNDRNPFLQHGHSFDFVQLNAAEPLIQFAYLLLNPDMVRSIAIHDELLQSSLEPGVG